MQNTGVIELPAPLSEPKSPGALKDKSSGYRKAQDAPNSTSNVSEIIRDLSSRYNVRRLSPRQMISLSRELFNIGLINYDQHAILCVHPETNPRFKPQPGRGADVPRDFVTYWENRLNEQVLYGTPQGVEDVQDILILLARLDPWSG